MGVSTAAKRGQVLRDGFKLAEGGAFLRENVVGAKAAAAINTCLATLKTHLQLLLVF